MACIFEYNGKKYSQDELAKELEKMPPHEAHKYIPGVQNIPDAPFKKSWHELVLKRAIREAAEGGYDRLSWTPGEAQAARYDLSKQVDEIRALKDKGGYTLYGQLKGSNNSIETLGTNISKDKLADYVGKDLAEKIAKQEESIKSYSGVDLKVGGEGMKGFYDKIIPNSISKLTGEKVKTTTIKTKNTEGVSGEQVMNDLGIPREQQSDYWRNLTQPQRDKLFKQYRTKDQPIHYIDITHALRDKVLKQGYPLFSAGVPIFSPVQGNPHNDK